MGTKLHSPHPKQTTCPVCKFRSEKCLQCLKNMGLYNSFGVGILCFWQSWLGYQLPQTCLSLIAHTWPILDQLRSCTPCVPPAQLTSKLAKVWLIYLIVMLKGSKEPQIWAMPKHICPPWNLRANWLWNWERSPQS